MKLFGLQYYASPGVDAGCGTHPLQDGVVSVWSFLLGSFLPFRFIEKFAKPGSKPPNALT